MNVEIWCKSFLSIYNFLPQLVSSIDKLVYLKSISSSNFYSYGETFNQVEQVANLTQKKINLINLKLLTDEVLLEMDKDTSKLLIFKYINGVSSKKSLEVFKIPRRTYFRRLDKALKDYEAKFYCKIIKNKIIFNNFSKDNFFDSIFEKINRFQKMSSDEDFEKYSNSMCNMILKQMKKL